MFNDMFGSFSSGAIGRLRFVGLTLLLGFGFVLVGMALGAGAGIFENAGGDPATAGAGLGIVALLVMLVAGVAVIVGQLNLVAKRARDIGWPVLPTVVIYLFFSFIVWFILALVPGQQSAQSA